MTPCILVYDTTVSGYALPRMWRLQVSFEMMVTTYETAWYHNPEDHNLDFYHLLNLISYVVQWWMNSQYDNMGVIYHIYSCNVCSFLTRHSRHIQILNFLITAFVLHISVLCQKGFVLYLPEWKMRFFCLPNILWVTKLWMLTNSGICVYVLSRIRVTLDGVLDWILDLLTTYTLTSCGYTLQITIAHRLVSSAYYSLHWPFLGNNFNTRTITVSLNYTLQISHWSLLFTAGLSTDSCYK
jgi:hypothetical protein